MTHSIIKAAGCFALSVLGKGQTDQAFSFFKPVTREGERIGGHAFRTGSTGSPVLVGAPASLECSLVSTVEEGDHSLFVGKVVDAGVPDPITGRPDAITLVLGDLGEKTFYGG